MNEKQETEVQNDDIARDLRLTNGKMHSHVFSNVYTEVSETRKIGTQNS